MSNRSPGVPSSVIPKVTIMRRERIHLVEIPLISYVDCFNPSAKLAQSPNVSYIAKKTNEPIMCPTAPEREPAAEQRDQWRMPDSHIERRLALRALVRRAKSLTAEQILALVRSLDRRRY